MGIDSMGIKYMESGWLSGSFVKQGCAHIQDKVITIKKDNEVIQRVVKKKVNICTDDINKHLYIRKDNEVPEEGKLNEKYFKDGVYRIFKYDPGDSIMNIVLTLDDDNHYLVMTDEHVDKWYKKLEE